MYSGYQAAARDTLFLPGFSRGLETPPSYNILLYSSSPQLAKRAGGKSLILVFGLPRSLFLVPDGVINVVTTQKNVQAVAQELCENKSVRKLSFTGSTAVAKTLYKMSASTMKK